MSDSLRSESREAAIHACAQNAEDMLDASERLLLSPPLPALAFHLAVLALEEIGKANILSLQDVADKREIEGLNAHLGDHKKKIFHALLDAVFGTSEFSGKRLQELQQVAANIHATRLQAIYVSEGGGPPSSVVGIAEAESMLGLAKHRLQAIRARKRQDLSDEDKADLAWFYQAADDEEASGLIFSGQSMKKLAELANVGEWVRWLRATVEEIEETNRRLTEEELARSRPEGEAAKKPKWKVSIRVRTGSHTIKGKFLTDWNRKGDWIKLRFVNKTNELAIDFVLTAGVNYAGVYEAGHDIANRILVALNIGSQGLFWWDIASDVDRWYESVTDLEANSRVVIGRDPALQINWHGGVLDEEALKRVRMVFATLPINSADDAAPYVHYLSGVGMLARTDVHMPIHANAFREFYRALRLSFEKVGLCPAGASFADALKNEFRGTVPEADIDELVRLGEATLSPSGEDVDLAKVGVLKVLCDAHFYREGRRRVQRLAEGESANAGIDELRTDFNS